MWERNEIDRKNMMAVDRITEAYPEEVKKYIYSLARKTSYTKKAYAYYVVNFLEYIKGNSKKINYKDIKPMDIDGYMEYIRLDCDGKEKSATYRTAQLAAIKGFFMFLKRNNMISENPCQHTEIPKDTKIKEITIITDEDYKLMVNNIINGVGSDLARAKQSKWVYRDIALLTIGITTGLRISAIVGINIDDINLKEKYIRVNEKGDVNKNIFIGDNTVDIIERWMWDRKYINCNDKEALFVGQKGNRLTPRAVEARFEQISEGTGKKITPHKMRATCATKLYEKTGDIYLVQQQLGHKSIKNTQRYAKVSEEKRREAAAILDAFSL